jgi:four helix bundle protein
MPRPKPLPAEPPAPDYDLLSRMRVYQIAIELMDAAREDAKVVVENPITALSAGQLYAAVISIAANIAEGYSRSSGRDRARFFEYALGSTRETEVWYRGIRWVLPEEAVAERQKALAEIRRMLLAIIPRERGRTIRPRATPSHGRS